MAKCKRCGKETELYDSGVPMCPACVDERDNKQCPMKPIPPDEGDLTKKR